jgi:hypothetical protein
MTEKIDMTNAATMALPKPSSSMRDVIQAAIASIAPFTTRAKRPSVMRVIGSVRSRTIGPITAFTSPKTRATTHVAENPFLHIEAGQYGSRQCDRQSQDGPKP